MSVVHLLAARAMPIFEQLQLEEALLRVGTQNFCLINWQSTPAIVMGISGKAEELIDREQYAKRPIPIIRRFSGGGTVLIGADTLFVTFIFNRQEQDIGTCPKRLLSWTEELLRPVFQHADFEVKENDYCLGNKKFGGNAQYFTKNRWLHHTSLLWDYCPEQMLVLKMPPNMPEYRQSRTHTDFLTGLHPYFASQQELFKKIKEELVKRFTLVECKKEELHSIRQTAHRKATEQLRF